MLKQMEAHPTPIIHAQPTVDALVDLIEDALAQDIDLTASVEMIMGFAQEEGVEEVVFQRAMEDCCPSYEALVVMVRMTSSLKSYLDLRAWAHARGETAKLDSALKRSGLLH